MDNENEFTTKDGVRLVAKKAKKGVYPCPLCYYSKTSQYEPLQCTRQGAVPPCYCRDRKDNTSKYWTIDKRKPMETENKEPNGLQRRRIRLGLTVNAVSSAMGITVSRVHYSERLHRTKEFDAYDKFLYREEVRVEREIRIEHAERNSKKD